MSSNPGDSDGKGMAGGSYVPGRARFHGALDKLGKALRIDAAEIQAAEKRGWDRAIEAAALKCADIYGPWDIDLPPEQQIKILMRSYAKTLRALPYEPPTERKAEE